MKCRQTVGLCSSLAILLALLGPDGAWGKAAKSTVPVEVRVVPVKGHLSMIEGVKGFAGGNVGVSVGKDGVILVDNELRKMAPKLKKAIASLSSLQVRFVINTHWHGDHSGGNEALAKRGALVLAHDSVRTRLSASQASELSAKGKPLSPEGLPLLTFSQDMTLHLNGDQMHVFHVAPAHTDGDVVVHFVASNVVHTGDLFLSQGYPYVDLGSGGNFEGFIAAADKILALCNDKTILIPGHGKLAKREDLLRWRNALETIRGRVGKLIHKGKTLAQAVAAKPTADLNDAMGSNFISADQIVEAAYRSMKNDAQHAH